MRISVFRHGFSFFINIVSVMILQFGIIFAFLAIAEFIVKTFGLPIPSSVIGMLLLTLSLQCGLIKLHHVDRLSSFLVHNLGFFFVPAGVGLINSLDVLSSQLLPIVGASVGSTVIIIAVTGQVYQSARKATNRRNKTSDSLNLNEE